MYGACDPLRLAHLSMTAKMSKYYLNRLRTHNNTEPDFVEEEKRFTVRLWKELEDTPSISHFDGR